MRKILCPFDLLKKEEFSAPCTTVPHFNQKLAPQVKRGVGLLRIVFPLQLLRSQDNFWVQQMSAPTRAHTINDPDNNNNMVQSGSLSNFSSWKLGSRLKHKSTELNFHNRTACMENMDLMAIGKGPNFLHCRPKTKTTLLT